VSGHVGGLGRRHADTSEPGPRGLCQIWIEPQTHAGDPSWAPSPSERRPLRRFVTLASGRPATGRSGHPRRTPGCSGATIKPARPSPTTSTDPSRLLGAVHRSIEVNGVHIGARDAPPPPTSASCAHRVGGCGAGFCGFAIKTSPSGKVYEAGAQTLQQNTEPIGPAGDQVGHRIDRPPRTGESRGDRRGGPGGVRRAVERQYVEEPPPDLVRAAPPRPSR